MGTLIGLILFITLWNTGIGRFFIGIAAKMLYSSIAFGLCMLIPIPIINVIIGISIVLEIWSSPVE